VSLTIIVSPTSVLPLATLPPQAIALLVTEAHPARNRTAARTRGANRPTPKC
jgi:hypothetical protein